MTGRAGCSTPVDTSRTRACSGTRGGGMGTAPETRGRGMGTAPDGSRAAIRPSCLSQEIMNV